ncbi:hypothetical protein ACOMHN_000693 [Nucella lapillus]
MRALNWFSLVYLLDIFAPWITISVRGQRSEVNQTRLDSLARTLEVTWTVVTNTREVYRCEATMTLKNTGSETLDYGDWRLYWYSVYPAEPDDLSAPGLSKELAGQGLLLTVVNGMLLYLHPAPTFPPLPPGASRVLRLKMKYWSVSRSDQFPNWYLTGSPGTNPRILDSTSGIDPPFLTPSRSPQQQKRYDFDFYADRSPEERYHRNYVPYASPDAEVRVVPKPWRVAFQGGSDVRLSSAWKIWDASGGGVLRNEVDFLVGKLTHLGVTSVTSSSATPPPPSTHVITLNLGNVVIADDDVMDDIDDAHSLEVDPANTNITVTGRGASGVFLGLQTLLALFKQDGASLPAVTVYDAPRFRFRGLFLDIARNFRSREEIERYLEVMAGYKLNKLHLHLSDDEGWRVQIPGLPELTDLGAKRCHDPSENVCLLPQLGSGPEAVAPGSGYLTTSDYQSILRTARRLHIEVIPEIDMPGHSRAAIKAMELRYRRLMSQNQTSEAERYRLIEENNPSRYLTAQFFNDNTVNVCLESVYTFIAKVVSELKILHSGIQNLKEFHVGLDEVAGAWINSTLCHRLQEVDALANQSLKMFFFKRMADITSAMSLNLGGWEDGLMLEGNTPFNKTVSKNKEVYANVWNSVWEWGSAPRTHNLANNGYKVVMSQGTDLYFDHPYEPHWEERGYYWATRFTDSQKVFGFLPMDYYANIWVKVTGQPLSREDVCGEDDASCPPLLQPQNIVGMQGHLWSETVRTRDQADSQLFPRVLALAERAWHYAPWERTNNVTLRKQLMTQDWYSFARAVGLRELPRLDRLGIKYRIPPPGAVVERGRLRVTAGYPDLEVEYSWDCSADHWSVVDGTLTLKDSDRLWLRTRSADGKRFSRTVEITGNPKVPSTTQSVLDYMGENLTVQFEITDNYERYGVSRYVATLFLNNTGNQAIPAGNWELQFPSVQWLEPELLRQEREFILQEHKMALSHVQGYLFRLSPLFDFPPFEAGTSKEIVFRGEYWSVSKYEQFPNYFVAAEGATARVIENTADESMSFVRSFSRVNQWKRNATDRFDPLTPSARYGKQADVSKLGWAPHPYLPTPLSFKMDRSKTVSFNKNWVIVAPSEWTDLAEFLKDQLNRTQWTIQRDPPPSSSSPYIQLRQSPPGGVLPSSPYPGAYNISVSPTRQAITIVANHSTGALYGIQSLINMALQSQDGATVFEMTARDAPRFGFRGMYLDVSRNFHSKESVLKLVRVMGLYKLNKLHIHLADDEGWRLEIPGLPELTTVGSRRCHDPTEEICLTPVMGSGPDPNNPGTGFYSVKEYQEILRAAAQRHIEVIPEFDTPGHARAAIKSMALRRQMKMEAGDPIGAHEYALDEEGDPSQYSSVQMYNDNAVNPCLESSYRFIRHVLLEVKKMHHSVNPLKVYHFGGDEVASGAWVESKACSSLKTNGTDLKFLYSTRVAAIAAEAEVDLGCWEDGIMDLGDPIPRKELSARHVFANAWQNVWEWGAASRAYYLANAGYKVIMGPATHTYFDFPSEPDPEERGFYWAARYTDSRKVFGFEPTNLWNNVDTNRMGEPITLQQVCGEENKGCPQLVEKDNVVGMQGHLWSETVRTPAQMDYMIFPRLLALAERAWHAAHWEWMMDEKGEKEKKEEAKRIDWAMFANSVGHGQFLVLDRLRVDYRLSPPGVRQEGADLKVNTEFPGLKTQYMTSDSGMWRDVISDEISIREGQRIYVRTMSPDGQRFSKAVSVTGSKYDVISSTAPSGSALLCMSTVLLCLLYATLLSWV